MDLHSCIPHQIMYLYKNLELAFIVLIASMAKIKESTVVIIKGLDI